MKVKKVNLYILATTVKEIFPEFICNLKIIGEKDFRLSVEKEKIYWETDLQYLLDGTEDIKSVLQLLRKHINNLEKNDS